MSEILKAIEIESRRQGLDSHWIEALIEVESAGRPWMMRYEEGWSYFEKPEYWADRLGQTLDTELHAQKFSFGPMQIMGSTARSLGFSGYLPELCLPPVGIHYGCLYLAQKLRKYGSYMDAVAAYNAGTVKKKESGEYVNQSYVDKVFKAQSLHK